MQAFSSDKFLSLMSQCWHFQAAEGAARRHHGGAMPANSRGMAGEGAAEPGGAGAASGSVPASDGRAQRYHLRHVQGLCRLWSALRAAEQLLLRGAPDRMGAD